MGFFEMRDLPFEVCQDSGIQSKMGAGFGTESVHPDARCLDRDYRIEGVTFGITGLKNPTGDS